jgi:hypothetical protein
MVADFMLMKSAMGKKMLIHEEDKKQKVKEITIVEDPQKLKMVFNRLSWNYFCSSQRCAPWK